MGFLQKRWPYLSVFHQTPKCKSHFPKSSASSIMISKCLFHFSFISFPLTGIPAYISLQQIKWGYSSVSCLYKSLSSALCLQSLNFGFVLLVVVLWTRWPEDEIKKHFSWMVGAVEPCSWNGNESPAFFTSLFLSNRILIRWVEGFKKKMLCYLPSLFFWSSTF